MQNKQDKKKKTNIKLNDLKPKKDAKGGVNLNTVGRNTVGRNTAGGGHNVNIHY